MNPHELGSMRRMCRLLCDPGMAAIAALAACSLALAGDPYLVRRDATKQLVLDSRVMESVQGARLTLGTVEKDRHNPLFAADKPWENSLNNLYPNVTFDEQERLFKLWYKCVLCDADAIAKMMPPRTISKVGWMVCYAKSKDGVAWEKPELNLHGFDGSTRNNITARDTAGGTGVFKDPHDPNPARRYKMIHDMGGHGDMRVRFSADGLRWSAPVEPAGLVDSGDTHSNAFWDDWLGKYVLITRIYLGERLVSRSQSDDFFHWTKPELILRSLPEEGKKRQTYCMPSFPYANVYLGYVMMYNAVGDRTVDCELAWSPDSVRWERVCPGQSLIPRGPRGSYDGGCIYGPAGPAIAQDGRLLIYYGGSVPPHVGWKRHCLPCLARLRLDGFAGYEPQQSGGTATVVTRPLVAAGGPLRVSADAQGGSLRVGVLDQPGFGLGTCTPISGNVTDAAVEWKGADFSRLQGKTVRLQFELRGAKLYAFQGLNLAPSPPPADLSLVRDGRSQYAIYVDEPAPSSVKTAARELQRIVRQSTGVELPLAKQPKTPMISLGENAAARAAGLSSDALADDAFRIAAKGQNLYILGKDTADGKAPWAGWTSRGTLFGTYDFLERVVGVRWLLPGPWGEDIPRHAEIKLPPTNLERSPCFAHRKLQDIQERRPQGDKRPSEVALWLLRHKLAPAADGPKLPHGHAWDDYLPPAEIKANPGFRAVDGGASKFCTSNPEAVDLFARRVVAWLDKRPALRAASISPIDGGDFCRCPKCLAQLTTDRHGRPSYTPVILKFYNQVARQVRKQHPDRLLAGYVYYNYMYPPQRPVPMESNLYLVWAPLNYYGWGLAKPVYRDEFREVLVGWLACTPNLVYHNYSTWMRSFHGAPLPPGLEILKLELPILKERSVWGVDMVGMGAWGYGAPGNYLLAKQMWEISVDVDATFQEWLQRAYGPGWQAMARLYRLLETRLVDRKRHEPIAYRGQNYEVNYDLIHQVHAPVFGEMESLYREALAKVASEAQQRRLEMFGENLVMLHYNMRKAGMLAQPESSWFYRAEDAYQRFLKDTEFSLALYRDHGKRYVGPIWKGEWRGD